MKRSITHQQQDMNQKSKNSKQFDHRWSVIYKALAEKKKVSKQKRKKLYQGHIFTLRCLGILLLFYSRFCNIPLGHSFWFSFAYCCCCLDMLSSWCICVGLFGFCVFSWFLSMYIAMATRFLLPDDLWLLFFFVFLICEWIW